MDSIADFLCSFVDERYLVFWVSFLICTPGFDLHKIATVNATPNRTRSAGDADNALSTGNTRVRRTPWILLSKSDFAASQPVLIADTQPLSFVHMSGARRPSAEKPLVLGG